MLTVQEIVNGVALNGLFQYYDQSAEKKLVYGYENFSFAALNGLF